MTTNEVKNNLNTSQKVMLTEIELEKERRARIELEKELEELKRKSQIMSD